VNLPPRYDQSPWLLKRKSFAHEKEVRVVHELAQMASAQRGGILIEVVPEKLIDEIVLSPLNDPWANEPIKSAIGQILERRGLNIPIRASTHLQPPASNTELLKTMQIKKFVRKYGLKG
jgi:hypothetical protein